MENDEIWDIGDYLDRARARLGIDSDNKLGREWGLSGVFVSEIRRKRKWPSDEKMVQLAALAGVDANKALLDLNIWRAPPDGGARIAYLDMLRKLVAAVIIGIGLTFAVGGATEARAGTNPERINTYPNSSIDYGK